MARRPSDHGRSDGRRPAEIDERARAAGRRGRACERIARDLGTTLFVSGGAVPARPPSWSAAWVAAGVRGNAHRVDRGHHLHREGRRRAAPAHPRPARRAAGDRDNGDDLVQQRCRIALDDLDQAALCTLHAFAQRILTAYPVEAGLPPRSRCSTRSPPSSTSTSASAPSTRRAGRAARAGAHGRAGVGAGHQGGPAADRRRAARRQLGPRARPTGPGRSPGARPPPSSRPGGQLPRPASA